MSLNVVVVGEYRGVGETQFRDKQTGAEQVYPYLRVEVSEETQRISCKSEVVKEVESRFKKGQEIKIQVRAYARGDNLKLSFVKLVG